MSSLNFEQLKKDKRVIEAKRLLKEALREAQENIVEVKEANPDLVDTYNQLLKEAGRLRGRDLFFPYLGSGLGKGALVELADGSVKYDFISGIGVHYLGHSHKGLLESSVDAALEDTIMQGNLQQGLSSVELLRRLVDIASQGSSRLAHCFLTSSGAMANENAFKAILQKKSPASRFLAFRKCFSGRTLATGQMTDKPEIRAGLPTVLNIDYLPFYDATQPEMSTHATVKALQEHLSEHPGEYAAMVFELIQGEGGYYPGETEFFKSIIQILKENNIAVMIDEIQTFGRTKDFFAFQYFKLEEYVDVVTIGKMAQVCATFFTEDINPKAGLLSQTFTSSTAAINAATVILDEVANGGYLGEEGKINQYSLRFIGHLQQLSAKYPDQLQGPFGVGAMIGFTAFDGSMEKSKAFIFKLYENGVLSFVAGKDPTRIRFLMPVGGVTLEDIDQVCRIIEKVLM